MRAVDSMISRRVRTQAAQAQPAGSQAWAVLLVLAARGLQVPVVIGSPAVLLRGALARPAALLPGALARLAALLRGTLARLAALLRGALARPAVLLRGALARPAVLLRGAEQQRVGTLALAASCTRAAAAPRVESRAQVAW